ncbi:MFS transporter [Streptomyces sp. BG2AG]|uniref:MFS transporter n=1 Tax=unclassified Streptomyces TaxID=2593676 RepID=UPI0039F00E8A
MAPRLILISPDFTRLWCGQAVSSLGDMVFSTTLMLWVATVLAGEETWAPAAVSGVLVAGGTAVLVVGPIAGVFVDRWDKRRIMLGTEALRGALVALLTAVAFLPTDALPAGVWLALVYGTVLVLHAAARVFAPARFTIIADLMKRDADRARAAGITQATTQTALILSPPLAAPLFFALGVQWALLFNALSYLVSYLAIRSVRIPEPTKAPLQKDSSSKAVAVEGAPPAEGGGEQDTPAKSGGSGVLAESVAGLRFFGRSKFLVALLVFAVIGQFGAGALSTLNIFFTTQNLTMPAHLFGYAGMAIGVGGIIGALCAGRVVQWIGARRTTWTGLLVSGALLIAYSRQTSLLGGPCAAGSLHDPDHHAEHGDGTAAPDRGVPGLPGAGGGGVPADDAGGVDARGGALRLARRDGALRLRGLGGGHRVRPHRHDSRGRRPGDPAVRLLRTLGTPRDADRRTRPGRSGGSRKDHS